MENQAEFVVLVVEDDELARSVMVDILSLRGYALLRAANAMEGLALLRTNQKIDLLVADVRLLGGIDGEQMVKTARASRPDLKVLFVTGYPQDLSQYPALSENPDSPETQMIQKPFGLKAFQDKVTNMLSAPAGAS